MGMALTHRTEVIGTCKVCESEVTKDMTYIGEDGYRGITLEAGGPKKTGYWVRCSNRNCEHHEGRGTLPPE